MLTGCHGPCSMTGMPACRSWRCPPTCQVKYRVHSVAISVCTVGASSSSRACARRTASIQNARRRHRKVRDEREGPIARQAVDQRAMIEA